MQQIRHLAFMYFMLPVKVGVVLTSICLRLCGCLYAHRVYIYIIINIIYHMHHNT